MGEAEIARAATKWAFLAAAALAATAGAAEAQLQPARVGAWSVRSHFHENRFYHCHMAMGIGGVESLIFAVGRSAFTLGIQHNSWNLEVGRAVHGYYQIDRGPRVTISGRVGTSRALLFRLQPDHMTFAQFRTGSSLRVVFTSAENATFRYSIAGSAAAFDRLYACASAGMAYAGPPAQHDRQVDMPGGERPVARAPQQRRPAAPAPPAGAAPARPPAAKASDPGEAGIGTGFYVSSAGHIVTAAHVIKNCKQVEAKALGDAAVPAVVVAKSEADDIALLKAAPVPAVAPLRLATLRLGEQIVLFGYPLSGALASSGNLTTGNIAALAGIKDDFRMIQISAPAQPGNSGGPVVDMRGRVVGVLVFTISTLKAAQAIGALPQNLNFAVKASVVSSFLEANGVAANPEGAAADLAVADVAEQARGFSVRIECKR